MKEIKASAKVLRSLNHKLRQQIIEILRKEGKMDVTSLYVVLSKEQSVISQHLKILRDQSVVTTEREGKFIFYSVNEPRIEQILAACKILNEVK